LKLEGGGSKKVEKAEPVAEEPVASPDSGLDDFLSEIKAKEVTEKAPKSATDPEIEAVKAEASNEQQRELDQLAATENQNEQALAGIDPVLIERTQEIMGFRKDETGVLRRKPGYQSEEDYNRARKEYSALVGDAESYRAVRLQEVSKRREAAGLYAQILQEFKGAGGTGDLKEICPYSSSYDIAQIEQQEKDGYAPLKDGSPGDEIGHNFESTQESLWRAPKDGEWVSPTDTRGVSSPDAYLRKLAQGSLDVSKGKGWSPNPEIRREHLRDDFESKVAGFGMAALEHGDVKVGAEAVALVEAVSTISPEFLSQIKAVVSSLDTEKQALFASSLEQARRRGLKENIDRQMVFIAR
jgi:hypothetical protein